MAACTCKGHSGQSKKLYPSRRRAVNVALRRGWAPTTYRCPSGKGFHLTHG